MTHSWPEVNAAVMAVLAEVGRNGRGRGEARPREDVFIDRLFALRHAEAAEQGPIRVAPGTVITPLARDLLRRRGIAIQVASGDRFDRRRGEWGFAIDSRSGLLEAFRRGLLAGPGWSEVGRDVVGAADWVIGGDGRGAMLVVDEASVATYRASRVEGIRPATVADPDAVTRAVRALGVNLVVVEPMGKSIHLLKQIGERFRLAGAPQIPGGWS